MSAVSGQAGGIEEQEHVVSAPLTVMAGQPLRVAVYDRISRTIRAGEYALGSLLPSDAEFSARLGVSRTVVREALLLLEEDRLIRTRRGVGRFVADALPTVGLERLRPIEEVLSTGGAQATVQTVSEGEEPATDFIAEALGVHEGDAVRTVESIVRRGGEPVCATFECVVASGGPFAGARTTVGGGGARTVLAALLAERGSSVLQGRAELIAGTVGSARGAQLDIAADAAVLVVTQFVSVGGVPAYLAKHVVPSAAGVVSLIQSPVS